MYVVVRVSGGQPTLSALRRGIREAVPSALVASARAMEDYVSQSVATHRFQLSLLAVFAGLALALSSVGLYGVISYTVAARTQEMGIRLALGASPGGVLRLVFADGLRLGAVGLGIGACCALGLTRLLAGMLYGVTPGDRLTFASVAVSRARDRFVRLPSRPPRRPRRSGRGTTLRVTTESR